MSYIKKTLSNGVRVMLVPLQENQTVTVMVLAETGSEYENKENNGISHFLEHLCFKGTMKRPSSKIINYELDAMGSQSNAFTSSEYTGFYAKAQAKQVHKIIDIVSDIYLHSTFPEEELQKEKGVVIEEINMYEDQPHQKVWEVLSAAMFEGQSAGRTILGTKQTVSSFSREDVLNYHKTHYVPEATLVVVSGKFDVDEVMKDLEEKFIFDELASKENKVGVVSEQKETKIVLHEKKSDQTHLVIGFRSFDTYSKNNIAVGLLSTILGGGMSSRLFTKMREELGICYYIRSGNSTSTDHGEFCISAGVSNSRLEEAVKGIVEEVKSIVESPVDEVELRKAKDYRIGNLYLGLESSDDFSDFYGGQEINHKEIMTPDEVAKRIEAVTAEEIQALAKEIFVPSRATLALVGPATDTEKLKSLLKW
jgi:predicted Zn-dependent peptidase